MSLADTAKLAVELNLGGNFDSKITGSTRKLDTFNSQIGKTARKVGQDLGHGLRTAGQNIERLAVAGAGLALGGGALAVKWAGDFDAGMRTINSVALATPEVLAKAGEGLRTTFRETGQSLDDLQAAEYDLVSAGIKLKDAQGGVNVAVHLGIGALGSTSEAVDVLTTAINSYNLKAADGTVKTGAFTRVADELAQAVADGKVKLSEIAASYAQVAPVAAAAGVKTGEIAAALGFLTAKGVPAAEVMTQMNRALVELQKPGPELKKVFKSLNTDGLALIKKEGLGGALETIRDRAAKLKIPFIDLFGRQEAYKFALQTTGPNAAGFVAELDRIAHSAGMTNKQFDERAGGFNYQLGVLKANVQDAGITIGTALLPRLTDMATKIADFLRGHQDDIKAFAADLGAGFEKAAQWASEIDWREVGDTVKGAAGFGKLLAEGFMTLPKEAKEIILGLTALNKLGGGAVVNIGVDLLKGAGGTLFQQLLGRGSPANPMFVVPIGGGLGGGIGGAAGAAGGVPLAVIFAAGTALAASLIATSKFIVEPKLQEQAGANVTATEKVIAGGRVNEIADALHGVEASVESLNPLQRALYELNAYGVKTHTESLEAALSDALTKARLNIDPRNLSEGNKETVDAVAVLRDKMESNRIALATGLGQVGTKVTDSERGIAGAIRAQNLAVSLSVRTNVSVTDINGSMRTHATYSSGMSGVSGVGHGI